jgi:hypothetical protein
MATRRVAAGTVSAPFDFHKPRKRSELALRAPLQYRDFWGQSPWFKPRSRRCLAPVLPHRGWRTLTAGSTAPGARKPLLAITWRLRHGARDAQPVRSVMFFSIRNAPAAFCRPGGPEISADVLRRGSCRLAASCGHYRARQPPSQSFHGLRSTCHRTVPVQPRKRRVASLPGRASTRSLSSACHRAAALIPHLFARSLLGPRHPRGARATCPGKAPRFGLGSPTTIRWTCPAP